MRASLILALFAVTASTAWAQGIRGVTRRTPTVIPGQTASQFFAAGGLPLNPVNPALANVPGASQNAGAGNRGFAAAPLPMVRPTIGASAPSVAHRPALPVAQPTGYPQQAAVNSQRR